MKTKPFSEWAILELFGHQRIAGRVSEQTIGGCSFIRVDVPPVCGPAFTRLFGAGAIYSITVTDQETAILAAKYWNALPMDRFTARNLLGLPTHVDDDEDKLRHEQAQGEAGKREEERPVPF